jgi:uncharacterized membrane protein
MTPFIVLAGSSFIFRCFRFSSTHDALRFALALMFLLTASAHWGKKRAELLRMVPPSFGHAGFFVTATGVLELAGAAGLLVPALARVAAAGLALLLLAMFPANVHAARAQLTLGGKPVTPLGLRTALQVVFVAVAVAIVVSG